jgi:hypothetical protein
VKSFKKLCKIGLFVVAVGLGVESWAQIQVSDPQNILGQSDEFLANPSFEKAYKVGDHATFMELTCEGGGICKLLRRTATVNAVSPSQVRVDSRYEDGQEYSVDITPTEYDQEKNFLRAFLNRMRLINLADPQAKFSISLDYMELEGKTLEDGSNATILDVTYTVHEVTQGNTTSNTGHVGLIQGAPGVRDIGYLLIASDIEPVRILLR